MADATIQHYRTHDLHEYGLNLSTRELFLVGEDYTKVYDDAEPGVEYLMASRLIKNLRILESVNKDPILVHMKTNGGEWMEGMAIYQAIKTCASHVTIVNWTHARSMSSIILQAADHRVMMPFSHFMFHDGTFGTEGTVKQAFTEFEQLKISCEQMLEIYIERLVVTGDYTPKTARRWLRSQMDRKEEVYLDAQRTVELNLADEVLEDYDLNRLKSRA